METPYQFLCQLVERLHNRELDFDQFLHGLDASDEYLRGWASSLQELQPPPGLEAGPRIQSCAFEGVQLLWESSGDLRQAETHAHPELVEAALNKAQEGHELIQEIFRLTEESIDTLGETEDT